MGDLFNQGPSPGERRGKFHERVGALAEDEITPGRLNEIAIELGAKNPLLLVEDFYKLDALNRKRKKELADLLPDAEKLPTGTVPGSEQISELLRQAGLPEPGPGAPVPTPIITGAFGRLPPPEPSRQARLDALFNSSLFKFADPEAQRVVAQESVRGENIETLQQILGENQTGVLERQRAGATSINIEDEIGSIPPGFELFRTPEGARQMRRIPGGPAALKSELELEKERKRFIQTKRYGDVVTQDADRILLMVKGSTFPVTGLTGNFLSKIPGTQAFNISKLVDTIRANVGFDRLQQMRAASPTGGALGQVSDRENILLQSTLGNLEQSQTQDQFVTNLERVKSIYLEIIHGPIKGIKTIPPLKQGMGLKERIDQLINMGLNEDEALDRAIDDGF